MDGADPARASVTGAGAPDHPDFDARYSRQIRFPQWGDASQQKLGASRALVVGMGALGSAVAEILVRAGVGGLRFVDRDVLHPDNLHRQTLYTEADAMRRLPKVEAAADHLRRINAAVELQPLAVEAGESNLAGLIAGCDLIVDGTDNFATRFLLNAFAVRNGIPFVHGGCTGCDGQVMTVLPGETPCLACLMPGGEPERVETCESVGVLMPIVSMVASYQAMQALKILSGNRRAVDRGLVVFSLWDNRIRQLDLGGLRGAAGVNCPVCGPAARAGAKQGETAVPERPATVEAGAMTVVALCGKNALQISSSDPAGVSLSQIAGELPAGTSFRLSRFVLSIDWQGLRVSVFADGRMVVDGSQDEAVARGLYERFLSRGAFAGPQPL